MTRKAICFTVALTFALMCMLTSCMFPPGSSSEQESIKKSAVCYVLAKTANSKEFNFSTPLIQDSAYNTIRQNGYISVVSVDGDPSVVFEHEFKMSQRFRQASQEKLDIQARADTDSLLSLMEQVVADDPEVDYLSSLRLAARSLASLSGYDEKTIIVLGTGLQTTGEELNFRYNLLCADPADIVENLRQKDAIPNFDGLTVYWQHLADVAEPQKKLTPAQTKSLAAIYQGIIESGGGTFQLNEALPYPAEEDREFPEVTPVELPDEVPIQYEQFDSDRALTQPLSLSEKQIRFVRDTSVFLDETTAMNALRPLADHLVAHRDVKVILIGTTAGDNKDSEHALALSRQRAEAVKQALCQLGAEQEQIRCIGMGPNDPWHISGVGYNGQQASVNRKVVVLNAASSMAQKILKSKFGR